MNKKPIQFDLDVAVGRREDGSVVYVRDLVMPLRSIAGGSHTYGKTTRTVSRAEMMVLAHDAL